MDIDTFEKRKEIGKKAAAELRSILERYGYIIAPFGQENYLNNPAHEQLRHIHNDPTVRAIRFAPDFIAIKYNQSSYWDSKCNTTSGTRFFSLEKSDYEELMARHVKGERCVLAFRDTDGTWSANYVENLRVTFDASDIRYMARGSKTPYLLISKRSAQPLLSFLKTIEMPEQDVLLKV